MSTAIRTVIVVLLLLAVSAAGFPQNEINQSTAQKLEHIYLGRSVVAVLRGPVRDVPVVTRRNMILDSICNALSDAKVHSKHTKIVVATKDKLTVMGSYKFPVKKGDKLLMIGKHLIHVITPEDARMVGTTIDKHAQYCLKNLKAQFDKVKSTGNEIMVNIMVNKRR
jgi:hypothetical protein